MKKLTINKTDLSLNGAEWLVCNMMELPDDFGGNVFKPINTADRLMSAFGLYRKGSPLLSEHENNKNKGLLQKA